MPIYKKRKKTNRFLILGILIILIVLMIISFSPNPSMNEIVLWP